MGKTLDCTTLTNRIDAYFAACDGTAERVTLKNGGVSCRQTPYTLAGLAEHLSVAQQAIREKAQQSGRMGRIYANALRCIERYTVERALLGELQYSVASMLLRGLGTGGEEAALPPAGDDNRIVIVLEDREGFTA